MKMKFFLLTLALFSVVYSIDAADNLAQLRTDKKIIRMQEALAPYFAIQIIALKNPPGDPQFFTNIDMAREYPCQDGYYRFCVGQYASYDEAKSQVESVKSLGYQQAFVVNTSEYRIKGQVKRAKIDPNKTYTLQLSAFRFPVYLSHFKDLDNVKEYRLKDKIFRYCIGEFKGSEAPQEIEKYKALGYKDAFVVELDSYIPFQIE